MLTTVVFDLDDTLYDEIDYCRSGFRAVARFLAKIAPIACSDDVFGSLWRHFTEGNRTRTFNAALNELGLPCDDVLVAQLVEVYRNHRPDLTLPPDSRLVLESLGHSYRLALLTDGFLPAQRLKVAALGIESHFAAIVYTEELGRAFWKPAPAGFESLMERLNVTAEQMAYVADNASKDFIAPNGLGMLSIQLRRSNGLHRGATDNAHAAARFQIDEITELPELLARLG